VIAIGVKFKQFTTTASQAIGPGKLYSFTVKARNSIGYSDASVSVTILSANKPAAPSAPVLTPAIALTVIVIDWMPPTDDQVSLYGAVITNYHVFVLQSDGVTYTEVNSDCPSNNAELISNTQCTVQVSTLVGYPFYLTSGTQIYAKITA
jgi:hypothetical protein